VTAAWRREGDPLALATVAAVITRALSLMSMKKM
jgi:hypothetical protein